MLPLRAAGGLRCRGDARRLLGFLELGSFGQLPARLGGGLPNARTIELPDGALAPRQGAPLVAVYRREARGCSGLAQHRGKQVPACGARADDVDLCFGDPARELEACRIGIGAGDRAGQSFDLVRPGRIVTGG
jgi:hypothetical protein